MQRKNSCPLCRRKVYWISIENQDYTFAKIKELQELTEYGLISTDELSENSTNSYRSASIPDSLEGFPFQNFFRSQETSSEETSSEETSSEETSSEETSSEESFETSSEESFILPSEYYVRNIEHYALT